MWSIRKLVSRSLYCDEYYSVNSIPSSNEDVKIVITNLMSSIDIDNIIITWNLVFSEQLLASFKWNSRMH